MNKISARIDFKTWEHIKKRLGAKTNQATVEMLIRYNQTIEANRDLKKRFNQRKNNENSSK